MIWSLPFNCGPVPQFPRFPFPCCPVHPFPSPFPHFHLPFAAMRRAIYPGSFDPVTNGHLDIIERGCKLFDEIIIAILVNPDKNPFFTVEERREMLTEVLKEIDRGSCQLRVDDFEGLLVNYAVTQKANAIVRGIRAISDYEYELQMALMNRRLEPSIETVFMMPAETYSYVSSRLVKEVFQLGGVLDGLVPALVEERMKHKVAKA
jgi:pantetheine-phosphate adenylyltransferase